MNQRPGLDARLEQGPQPGSGLAAIPRARILLRRPAVPNADAYPVDYRIEGKSGIPLFLYGVPNRDKARLTTIMLGYFHRHGLSFESIIVFEDPARDSEWAGVSSLDLAELLTSCRCGWTLGVTWIFVRLAVHGASGADVWGSGTDQKLAVDAWRIAA